ncbi:MAG TPA: dephospho-CoA kinase [Acidimicrobiia bacterium]|nr:dephospho-CoA kinase [Acidimicrobiia bacterium]
MSEIWVVTGGIGSGKSTIRHTLEELGAISIDADRVGHAVLEPGGAAHEAVAARWPEVVRPDGSIDRARLGSIVFADADQLRELEGISHPAIGAEIARRVAEAGSGLIVVEISVPKDLVGAGWLRTIVADLPDDERRSRLSARGMAEGDIERRMSAQPPRHAWRGRGRWLLSTAGTRDEVAERVQRLWRDVIRRG